MTVSEIPWTMMLVTLAGLFQPIFLTGDLQCFDILDPSPVCAALCLAYHATLPKLDCPGVLGLYQNAGSMASLRFPDLAVQGELVTTPMLNCILAACGQIGDMARALETFEQIDSFTLKPDTGSYNAVLHCCVSHNFLESVPKVCHSHLLGCPAAHAALQP